MKQTIKRTLLIALILGMLSQGALQAMNDYQNMSVQEAADLQRAIDASVIDENDAQEQPAIDAAAAPLEIEAVLSAEPIPQTVAPGIISRFDRIRRDMTNGLSRLTGQERILGIAGLTYIGMGRVLLGDRSIPNGLRLLDRMIEPIRAVMHATETALINTIDRIPLGIVGSMTVCAGATMLSLAACSIYERMQRQAQPADGQNAIQRQAQARAAWEAGAPARMAAMQAAQHDAADEEDNDPNAIQCSVCLINIKADESKASLICNHSFHRNCLGQWLTQIANDPRAKNCPLCRDNK